MIKIDKRPEDEFEVNGLDVESIYKSLSNIEITNIQWKDVDPIKFGDEIFLHLRNENANCNDGRGFIICFPTHKDYYDFIKDKPCYERLEND